MSTIVRGIAVLSTLPILRHDYSAQHFLDHDNRPVLMMH